MSRKGRLEIASRRLLSVLSTHGIALARTLEQKIADAGPYNQRVNPHIITEAKKALIAEGKISVKTINGTPWYYLADIPTDLLNKRLDDQLPTYTETWLGQVYQASRPDIRDRGAASIRDR